VGSLTHKLEGGLAATESERDLGCLCMTICFLLRLMAFFATFSILWYAPVLAKGTHSDILPADVL
jgi:hypothetical protein